MPNQSLISNLQSRLHTLYHTLYAHFGHEPHWWPIISDTPQFEMLVGAILVQQTRWETVEAAVVRLRDAGLLNPIAMAAADTTALAVMIRPCAFQMQKAPGLQAICRHLIARYDGDVGALLAQDRATVRAELLALPRIGRETADTIMLYAGGHPVFIVDAYARRLLGRLDLVPGFDFDRARYDDIQALIEGAVTGEIGDWRLEIADFAPTIPMPSPLSHFYWNLHALIIEECIHHCLASKPRQDRPGVLARSFVDPRKCAEHCIVCQGCPLREICATYHR